MPATTFASTVPGGETAPTYHGDAQEGWADQKHWGWELAPTSFPERVEEFCPADNPQQKPQGLEEKCRRVLRWVALEHSPAQPRGDQTTPRLPAVVLGCSTSPLEHR